MGRNESVLGMEVIMTKNFYKAILCAAAFGVIGGVMFQGVDYVSNSLFNQNPAVEGQQEPGKDTEEEKDKDAEKKESEEQSQIGTASTVSSDKSSYSGVSDVAEAVLPSIVAIDVTVVEQERDFFGRTYEQEGMGSGSGIIISNKGGELLIATNNHVVADATKVSVKFNDGNVYSATVKGTDSTSDLAVVSVKGSDLSSDTVNAIKVATLGDSEELKVGEQAIAIGNALGYGTSVTVGYISATEREVATDDATMKLLQTDAAINPGNSGGALVNSKGEVIGINSAKYASTEVEGMGFAIPISKATPIIQEMVDREAVPEDQQAYLGIKPTNVDEQYAQYYNMPEGVYVGSVSEDSPAEKAGLLPGDIIVEYDGKETITTDALEERLSYSKAGTEIKLLVKRLDSGEYKDKEITVVLGNKKDAAAGQDGNSQDGNNQDGNSGSQGNNGNNGNGGNSDGNGNNGNGYEDYYDFFNSPFGW